MLSRGRHVLAHAFDSYKLFRFSLEYCKKSANVCSVVRDTVYRRYVRIPYIRVNEGSLIQRNICNIPTRVQYSAVSTYNVTW